MRNARLIVVREKALRCSIVMFIALHVAGDCRRGFTAIREAPEHREA